MGAGRRAVALPELEAVLVVEGGEEQTVSGYGETVGVDVLHLDGAGGGAVGRPEGLSVRSLGGSEEEAAGEGGEAVRPVGIVQVEKDEVVQADGAGRRAVGAVEAAGFEVVLGGEEEERAVELPHFEDGEAGSAHDR